MHEHYFTSIPLYFDCENIFFQFSLAYRSLQWPALVCEWVAKPRDACQNVCFSLAWPTGACKGLRLLVSEGRSPQMIAQSFFSANLAYSRFNGLRLRVVVVDGALNHVETKLLCATKSFVSRPLRRSIGSLDRDELV